MEFTTNNTSEASHTPGGDQLQAFSWQNPMFPMPSPRSRPSGPDRLPGTVHSHRPRWTPGKHARILAQIKANRTDLDPSFPRHDATENADHSSKPYALSEVISNFAQGTKSYFDSLTAYALEQLYGPTPPVAPATGAHPGTAPSTGRKDADKQGEELIKALQEAGASRDVATEIVLVWTANGIPLNAHAAPSIYNPLIKFYPEDKLKSSSGASLVSYEMGNGASLVLKCYPPASEVDLRWLTQKSGIDPHNPKREARCLLASLLAHDILGWDIIPKASMGYFGGRACLVTPKVDGMSLQSAFENNLAMAQAFFGSIRDGIVYMDEWGDYFTPAVKQDFMRILVFTVLVGDSDRHYNQFIISADNKQVKSIKAIDWDATFGSKKTDDKVYIKTTLEPTSLWPSAIPQAICDEFGKVTEANLKEAADIGELSDDETAALMSRFGVIKKKLAGIKKT